MMKFALIVLWAAFSANVASAAPPRLLGLWGSGNKLVARYEYSLKFFKLPENMALIARPGKYFLSLRASPEEEVGVEGLKPYKTITFKHPIEVEPAWPRITETNILVCTQQMAGLNSKGKVDDFCGIISVTGQIVYKFKVHQSPQLIASASGMSRDGKQAQIIVGGVAYGDEGGPPFVAPVKQVILWTFPNKETATEPKEKNETNSDHWRARFSHDWTAEEQR
jgi:hypothetical protein